MVSFYSVQGSDPGYINSDAVTSDDCEEDYLEYPHDPRATMTFLGSNNMKSMSHNPEETEDFNETDAMLSTVTTDPSDTCKNLTSQEMLSKISRNYRPGEPSGLPVSFNRTVHDSLRHPTKKINDLAGRGKNKTHTGGRGTAFQLNSRKSPDKNISKDENSMNKDIGGDNYESYCKYCEISVPLRSHHCNHCQRCVATFDHHCFVIGTCIGERNHCRFYSCLLLNFFGVWCLSLIVDGAFVKTEIEKSNNSTLQTTSMTGQITPAPDLELAFISSVFLGITWWYMLLLVTYQTGLICISSTGYECIKSSNNEDDSDACDSPYSGKNIFESLFSFCCVRDGIFSTLKNIPWKPVNWKKPPPKQNYHDVTVRDNFCRNKYYACC